MLEAAHAVPLIEVDTSRIPVVVIKNGEAIADSRDVAAYFVKDHKRVLQTIRELHCSDDFRRHHFVPFKNSDLAGEHTSHVMMTKNGFVFLAMGFTGERASRFKEAYIQQFDAMESELHSRPVPQTREQIMASALLLADQTMKEQAEQIAVLAPKAEALDLIAGADGSLNITETAKALQIGPKELFRFMSMNGWIYRRAGSDTWLGYQAQVSAGLLTHKVATIHGNDGIDKVREQVRVTPRGLTKLAKLMPSRLTVVEQAIH